ncbi:MAG: hypothetical protein GY749_38780 [Desulfobacteraceae bacterium]|nr:hypothetical protein [Desulfobacteraceae bacterium]
MEPFEISNSDFTEWDSALLVQHYQRNIMLKHPRLKPCYHAEFLDDEKVLLISEKDNAVLSSKLYNLVLSEIRQNSFSTDELLTRLEGKISAFEIYYAIESLEKKGYITEAVPLLPQEICAYWNTQGIEMNSLLKVLQDKAVSVETA